MPPGPCSGKSKQKYDCDELYSLSLVGKRLRVINLNIIYQLV